MSLSDDQDAAENPDGAEPVRLDEEAVLAMLGQTRREVPTLPERDQARVTALGTPPVAEPVATTISGSTNVPPTKEAARAVAAPPANSMQDVRDLFAGAGRGAREGLAQSMWDRLEAGKKIPFSERVNSPEHYVQSRHAEGEVRGFDDVMRMLDEHGHMDAAAKRGEFQSPEDVRRVRNAYRAAQAAAATSGAGTVEQAADSPPPQPGLGPTESAPAPTVPAIVGGGSIPPIEPSPATAAEVPAPDDGDDNDDAGDSLDDITEAAGDTGEALQDLADRLARARDALEDWIAAQTKGMTPGKAEYTGDTIRAQFERQLQKWDGDPARALVHATRGERSLADEEGHLAADRPVEDLVKSQLYAGGLVLGQEKGKAGAGHETVLGSEVIGKALELHQAKVQRQGGTRGQDVEVAASLASLRDQALNPAAPPVPDEFARPLFEGLRFGHRQGVAERHSLERLADATEEPGEPGVQPAPAEVTAANAELVPNSGIAVVPDADWDKVHAAVEAAVKDALDPADMDFAAQVQELHDATRKALAAGLTPEAIQAVLPAPGATTPAYQSAFAVSRAVERVEAATEAQRQAGTGGLPADMAVGMAAGMAEPTSSRPSQSGDAAAQLETPTPEKVGSPAAAEPAPVVSGPAPPTADPAAAARQALEDYLDALTRGLNPAHAAAVGKVARDKLDAILDLGQQPEVALRHATRRGDEENAAARSGTGGYANRPGLGQHLEALTAGMGKELGGIGSSFKGLAGATQSLTGLAAGLTALAASGGPAMFGTMSKSVQLLGATLAQIAVEPITRLAFGFQDAAHWLQQLDPAVKGLIASWGGWAAGGLAVAAVTSKIVGIVGNLLPLVGALASPIGLLAVGLGVLASEGKDAFAPLTEAAGKLAGALGSAFGSVRETVGAALAGVAQVAGGVLVTALEAVTGVVKGFQEIAGSLGATLGVTGTQLATAAAAAYLFASPLRAIVGITTAVVAGLAKISPVLAVVGGVLTAGVAIWILYGAAIKTAALAMASAFVTNPITAIITAIGVAVGAVMGLAGAFRSVGEGVDEATRRIEKMADASRRAAARDISEKDVFAHLNQEELRDYSRLKTDSERKKFLEEKAAEAKTALKEQLDPAEIERREAVVKKVLEKNESLSNPGEGDWFGEGKSRKQTREDAIVEALKAEGMNADLAKDIAKKAIKNMGDNADAPKLNEKDIERGAKVHIQDREVSAKIKARADVFEAAADQLGKPGGKGLGPGSREEQHRVSVPKEMHAGFNSDFLAPWKALVSTNLEKDSLDRQILQTQRDIYVEMRKVVKNTDDSPFKGKR